MKKQNQNLLHKITKKTAAILFTACLITGTIAEQNVYADAEHSEYAKSNEMSKQKEILKYGMTPISGEFIKDGTYEIEVKSTSSFFRVHSCELIVEGNEMKAKLTMETYSYPLLYMGTSEEAAAAEATDYIEYEDIDDWYVFTVPVKALNCEIDCASFSKKKKKWYNRKILFDAASLPEEALDGFVLPDYTMIQQAMSNETGETATDSNSASVSSAGENTSDNNSASDSVVNASGEDSIFSQNEIVDLPDGRYSVNVALTGGSGRASVSTPTLMIVKDGQASAQLMWSSSHYDWMQINGVTYQNEAEEGGNSVFTIPIPAFDAVIPIVADTTAMGDPVAIDYSLTFYRESIGDEGLIPQVAAKKVVIFAVGIIIVGFFLNLFVKKKRKR